MDQDTIRYEIAILSKYKPVEKDILIVVHNQLPYVKNCIEGIKNTTSNYNLYIWDNASNKETADYLKSIDATYIRSEENIGFIKPNNHLASIAKSPYLILLNTDTETKPNWDKALISWLQNTDYSLCGYLGGCLNEYGVGYKGALGDDADYICGWCMCLSRQTYLENGLFDSKNLSFAYCEDSDLAFRLKSRGKRIYALSLNLVHHYSNKTVTEVLKTIDLSQHLRNNHAYIRQKWLSGDKSL